MLGTAKVSAMKEEDNHSKRKVRLGKFFIDSNLRIKQILQSLFCNRSQISRQLSKKELLS